MSRLLLCVASVLVLAVGLVADEKPTVKKGETVKGMIQKVDPSANKLTVKFDGDKEPPFVMFDILPTTKFIFSTDDGKKEMVGKAAYKNKNLAEGARVTAVTDGKTRLLEVRISPPEPRKK